MNIARLVPVLAFWLTCGAPLMAQFQVLVVTSNRMVARNHVPAGMLTPLLTQFPPPFPSPLSPVMPRS